MIHLPLNPVRRISCTEMSYLLPSETVPDQCVPLDVLLQRAQRGTLDLAGYYHEPQYDNDGNDVVDIPERPLDSLDALNQVSYVISNAAPERDANATTTNDDANDINKPGDIVSPTESNNNVSPTESNH